jgi:hypothetical protein
MRSMIAPAPIRESADAVRRRVARLPAAPAVATRCETAGQLYSSMSWISCATIGPNSSAAMTRLQPIRR